MATKRKKLKNSYTSKWKWLELRCLDISHKPLACFFFYKAYSNYGPELKIGLCFGGERVFFIATIHETKNTINNISIYSIYTFFVGIN
jgi:hypothetical protein